MTGVVCDLCDHPLLTVLLEEGVPGGPTHGRGGVQAIREGIAPREEKEEGGG